MARNHAVVETPDTEDQPLLRTFNAIEDPEQTDELAGHSDDERKELERTLLRKLDRRMSILVLIYILNYIDRNNTPAARLLGFEEDLHLEGTQFASILSILYIGYILMQVPSNMFLNYIGKPSIYLPSCMIIWGGLSVCTVRIYAYGLKITLTIAFSYFGALCIRFFLGFVEAAFFPGALFLLAKWYKQSELSQRTALWLFFVEGTITICVAIWAMFVLPDFPENSSNWLTPAEKALAMKRMQEDSGHDDLPKESIDRWPGLHLAVTDWKVWWLALTLLCIVISLSFNVYFPTLTATLGYGPIITLLLCAPPWLFATGVALSISRHSDKVGERSKHIASSLFVGICGFVLSVSTMNTAVRYFSLFLMAQSYGGFIVFLAWASGSISYPPAKRAVALALINCISQLGNVIGS
ncbi:tartrate transporter [Pholiota molesta]|nr:tartrate transporter [Pholiota molesta]